MEYQNRLPEEGINTPGRHPLAEFIRLGVIALVALLLLGLLLNFAGGHLAGLIPYKAELWATNKIDRILVDAGEESPFSVEPSDAPLMEYLNSLGDRVEQALEMESPMTIQLHYSDEDVVNAFATLGGHVYLYKGLLRQLPHENALTMLLAHEYSHVQMRHALRGVGGGLAVAIGAAMLPGGAGVEGKLYSLAGSLSNMNFSRDMETDADSNGLKAVNSLYGHTAGADDLFELFMAQRARTDTGKLDSFFSTHPLDRDRIEALAELSREQGWRSEGELTPLPDGFSKWLEAAK
jgi:Zn-dependent protease with chaperone function